MAYMGRACSKELLKIGDLARISNKTVRTLHFYEELEILRPLDRTKGGFRLYAPESVTRIWLIEKLQVLGLSLPEIRDFLVGLQESETGYKAAEKLKTLLAEKRQALREEISRLQHLEQDVNQTLDYLHHCITDCSKDTAPVQCTACDHAANEETRPKMISGIYPQ